MSRPGYNIFVSGDDGSGRLTAIKEEIKKIEKVSIGTENNSNMEQNLSEEDIQIITNYLMINYGVIESNIILERSGFENEKI